MNRARCSSRAMPKAPKHGAESSATSTQRAVSPIVLLQRIGHWAAFRSKHGRNATLQALRNQIDFIAEQVQLGGADFIDPAHSAADAIVFELIG